MSPPLATAGDLHIAVLAFPFGTHAPPLLSLVRRLAAAVPDAHFSFLSTAKSNKSLFAAGDGIGNIRACNVPDGLPENYVFSGRPEEEIEMFLEAAPESFRRGMEAAAEETGRRVSCLIGDAFLWFAADLAEELEAFWVAFWVSGADSLCVHVHTDLIREKIGIGGIEGREDETLHFIPGLSKVRVRDLPDGVLSGNLDSLFPKTLHQMSLELPRAIAILISTFDDLEPIITNDLKSKLNDFLTIGPLNFTLTPQNNNYNCISWLDKQKNGSVVYVSFGSMVMLPPNELLALVEALEASQVPFIWSLKNNLRKHLPEGFLDRTRDRGMVVPWAPQREILQHGSMGAFVNHGGWNSVVESIIGGVPMICRPFFGDHKINARMVEMEWEIGIAVEQGVLTKKGLMSSLEKILSQDEGKQMKARITTYKEQAIKAIGENGSSEKNLNKLVHVVSSKSSIIV